ncbi:hypothetical protein QBC33DRAFT_554119 [Phialemonium atrogriseum]|uniref:Uncharacterized protein n=1 Tax=Phialemonium atrogriseum TaxID=1093897 RepID=A0AAJ0C9J1_9PEZI|nr:uncharacterized protein QBC33DRAFT_554119 [Phialemonium atrogriseum]KAK1772673.1 hypothetical protein QBC33DRAFT_554119 [Phialemonium atrogriseum]
MEPKEPKRPVALRPVRQPTAPPGYQGPCETDDVGSMLEKLSPEILGEIIGSLDDFVDLGSLYSSSPVVFQAYLIHRRRIIMRIVLSHVEPEILNEALAIVYFPTLEADETPSEKQQKIINHIKDYHGGNLRPPEPCQFDKVKALWKLHTLLDSFIDDFAYRVKNKSWSNAPYWSHRTLLPQAKPGSPFPLSPTEKIRFRRAFARFELFATAFPFRSGPELFSAKSRFDLLLSHLKPWELEEMRCVDRYVLLTHFGLHQMISGHFYDAVRLAFLEEQSFPPGGELVYPTAELLGAGCPVQYLMGGTAWNHTKTTTLRNLGSLGLAALNHVLRCPLLDFAPLFRDIYESTLSDPLPAGLELAAAVYLDSDRDQGHDVAKLCFSFTSERVDTCNIAWFDMAKHQEHVRHRNQPWFRHTMQTSGWVLWDSRSTALGIPSDFRACMKLTSDIRLSKARLEALSDVKIARETWENVMRKYVSPDLGGWSGSGTKQSVVGQDAL